MVSDHFILENAEGVKSCIYRWLPAQDAKIKAAIIVAHGMAEHGARYARFAAFLTASGYVVYAPDLRGHGKTAGNIENIGSLGGHDGFYGMLDDLRLLAEIIKKEHQGLPLFLFGHSMGALLVQGYISRWGDGLQGAVLSGAVEDPGMLSWLGFLVASLEAVIRGQEARSRLLHKLCFGRYNRFFQPARTDFEWLSRDAAEVDIYVADPACGGIFTAGFYRHFFSFLRFVNSRKYWRAVPRRLPLYFFSGARDPVGGYTRGVKKLIRRYQAAGLTDVNCKFYHRGRHETLNEINREEVTADVISWLNGHI
jgi:alpha-beta hydrolase superfamily lysophospholipase